MPRLFDAHMHCGEGLAPEALPEGFGAFCCGTRPEDWPATLALAERVEGVVPFVGVHPWEVDTVSPDWPERLESVATGAAVGVGEFGLDRGRQGGDFARQLDAFRVQVKLAVRLERPCALHCVRAWGPLLDLFRRMARPRPAFMLHWYAGSVEMLGEFLRLGAYVSYSPDSLNRKHAGELLRATPRDRLLIETDLAYGADVVPCLRALDETYARAAEMLNRTPAQLKEDVWNNGQVFTNRIAARS